MNITKTTGVGINTSIELFLYHYRFGMDYNSSSVLVDSGNNIIAFFDNASHNIDVIIAETEHKGNFIIANGVGVNTKKCIKFQPSTYYDIYKKCKKGSVEADKAIKEMSAYNLSYFNLLMKNLGE